MRAEPVKTGQGWVVLEEGGGSWVGGSSGVGGICGGMVSGSDRIENFVEGSSGDSAVRE